MPQNYLILNTKTGKVIYSSRENRQFSVVVSRVFVPEAGVILLLGQGPKNPQKTLTLTVPILAGFDAETGAEIFRREAFQSSSSEQLVPVGMVSDGERVFYMSDRRVYAANPRTGQVLWQANVSRWFAADARPRLFIDRERQQVLVFARERLAAYRFADGSPV
jgi:outer membrane protein assembly factor BamB